MRKIFVTIIGEHQSEDVMLLHNIVAEVLANLINGDKKIKGMQIWDHQIKIYKNIADNTTSS